MRLTRELIRGASWMRDLVLTMLVLPIAAPLWLLPAPSAVRLGRVYGAIGALFWGKARRAGIINLKKAFPAISFEEAAAVTRRVFSNMGQSIAEGIQFSRRELAALAGGTFTHEEPELARAIVEDPRPKIFVTAHHGSWEVALMLARDVTGGRGAVIARAVDNPFLNEIVRRVRFRSADEWIEKRGAVELALARLRNGESVAMLIDENGGARGPHVPFFGRGASTRKTPALLSIMTGAPIVIGTAVRRENAPMLFRLATIEPAEHAGGPDAIVGIMTQINATLERWIRDDVEQWRWIHWRWRTRPDGTSESYTRGDVRRCFDWNRVPADLGGEA